MLRLVYDNGGGVKIDPTGREKGRGTYLCLSPECNPNTLRKSQLEHALRASITEEGWREFQGLLQKMRSNG